MGESGKALLSNKLWSYRPFGFEFGKKVWVSRNWISGLAGLACAAILVFGVFRRDMARRAGFSNVSEILMEDIVVWY